MPLRLGSASLRGSWRRHRADATHPKRSKSAARCRSQSPDGRGRRRLLGEQRLPTVAGLADIGTSDEGSLRRGASGRRPRWADAKAPPSLGSVPA